VGSRWGRKVDNGQFKALVEGLAAPLSEKLDGMIKPLATRLELLERDQVAQSKRLEQAIGKRQDPKNGDNKDQIWSCQKCKSRLAFYDTEADVIRTSWDGHIVHSRLGVGGYVSIVCRDCAEVNTLEYTPPAGQTGIQGGVLRMNVETLEKLLEQARNSEDSMVAIELDGL